MTKEELKQKAYEYAIKEIPFIECITQNDLEILVQQAYITGAEFGYNKANEWHYMKDGNLPKEDNRIMLCYCRKGYHGNIGIYGYRLFTKKEFMGNNVIAWKEIVLPKESEECTH